MASGVPMCSVAGALVSLKPVATWHRDYPEASHVDMLPAGTVCLVYNTNGARTAWCR